MKDPFTDTAPPVKVTRRKKESTLEKSARKYAKDLGFWYRKFKSPGKRSAPDDVFSREDTGPFWVEFKKEGEEPTDKQDEEHKVMRAHGCRVYVCDRMSQFEEVLRKEIAWALNDATW